MSFQGTIHRYTLLIEKINSRPYCSFQNLKDYLQEHGFEISPRTLQRDLEDIRDEFSVAVRYDRNHNGYYIDKTVTVNFDAFLRFLEIAGTSNMISESMRESKNTLNYISFEAQGNLTGIENLKSLLYAVKNHRKINFFHENYETGIRRKYSLKPYLLKEYQNRWYVVGIISGMTEFRTFGIDRIENLEVSTETFKPDGRHNVSRVFENTVGLVYSFNKLEEVVLSFTPLQARYVKALPLHKSQEIVKETNKEVIIKLLVIPNFELKQKILMLGDSVRVVSPPWFRGEVKRDLGRALKQYHEKDRKR